MAKVELSRSQLEQWNQTLGEKKVGKTQTCRNVCILESSADRRTRAQKSNQRRDQPAKCNEECDRAVLEKPKKEKLGRRLHQTVEQLREGE